MNMVLNLLKRLTRSKACVETAEAHAVAMVRLSSGIDDLTRTITRYQKEFPPPVANGHDRDGVPR